MRQSKERKKIASGNAEQRRERTRTRQQEQKGKEKRKREKTKILFQKCQFAIVRNGK